MKDQPVLELETDKATIEVPSSLAIQTLVATAGFAQRRYGEPTRWATSSLTVFAYDLSSSCIATTPAERRTALCSHRMPNRTIRVPMISFSVDSGTRRDQRNESAVKRRAPSSRQTDGKDDGERLDRLHRGA